MAADYTLEELLIATMAREFKGGRIGVGATILGDLAARLAKALYVPDLFLMTASRAAADCDVHPKSLSDEWVLEKTARIGLDWQQMFQAIAQGRFQIWIGAVQIDRFGNSNISCIGQWEKPRAQLIGARGIPDDLWGCERLDYHIRRQTPKSFVEKVDFVCGLGYGAERRALANAPARPGIVISDLGTYEFDSEREGMRICTLHPGVTFEQAQRQTGFELIRPNGEIPITVLPTTTELRCIREVIDPLGLRRLDSSEGGEQLMREFWHRDGQLAAT